MFWLVITGLWLVVTGLLLWPLRAGKAKGQNTLLLLTVSVLVPAVTLLLYWHWGAYSRVSQAALVQQRLVEVTGDIDRTGSRQHLIDEFEHHLQEQPQSAQGWYLLGKLYLRDGRAKAAVTAFSRARELKPHDTESKLGLAQALFIVNANTLTPQAQALLQQVLAVTPESPAALTLLATDAYNKGLYNQAIIYFERLLPYYPPESEDGKRLLAIIAQAQKRRQ
jgi:cytochrome c-type biogenesis protein CcmH